MHRLHQANNVELLLHYFELHLLEEVGYRPQLQQCVHCHSRLKPVINHFSTKAGGVLCPECSQNQSFTYSLSVNALKVLRLLQSRDYDTVSRLKMNPELSRELDRLMSHYIEYLLDREVKAVAWLNILREQIKENRV